MKQIISTEKAPAAIGPYAQGVAAGKLIITSGQLPLDPATGAFPRYMLSSSARAAIRPVRLLKLRACPRMLW